MTEGPSTRPSTLRRHSRRHDPTPPSPPTGRRAYGLDTMSAGVMIAFAMELFERGILTLEDTGGIDLDFGNDESMVELIHLMGEREGFGDVLQTARALPPSASARAGAVRDARQGAGVAGRRRPRRQGPTASVRDLQHRRRPATRATRSRRSSGLRSRTGWIVSSEGQGRAYDVERGRAHRGRRCDVRIFMLRRRSLPSSSRARRPDGGRDGPRLRRRTTCSAWAMRQQPGQGLQHAGRPDARRRRLAGAPKKEPIPQGPAKGQMIPESDLDLTLDEHYEARAWTPDGVRRGPS